MERFGKPGKSMTGSDSHTPAAGALGMLALGAGGLDVAFAMAGEPVFIKMPKILGGKLPRWVSAKDVILEMLRRYDVKGCRGMIVEYYGPGLQNLDAMDRHVIANMGTELGATTTVFPSDEITRHFLKAQQRENDWQEIKADQNTSYDLNDEINLSELQPLIAYPSSPGNVVMVREVEHKPIYQVVIGSSANPGLRDFRIAGEIVKNKFIHERVSFDINPTSRQVIQNLVKNNGFANLMQAGARFHQSGCMGCIGMGQAPATNQISLRTMPRNFPGRSGTREDKVYLCSPETAAASALTGVITDPRDLEKLYGMKYPRFTPPEKEIINTDMLVPPPENGEKTQLKKGPNIKSLPHFPALENEYSVPVILKMGDNISTDEILPAGAEILPYRSNIPRISEFAYSIIDNSFYDKAQKTKEKYGGHIVLGGENSAQGSSREHAALAPKYLGQVAVIAKSYARIGWQNLVNFGIPPLEFKNPQDYESIDQKDVIEIKKIKEKIQNNNPVLCVNKSKEREFELTYTLSKRQRDVILAGGVINYFKL